ncbi:MAG: hypothetical protein GY856_20855 [bacterium]|nr:hypothetical protein [bacterium]
MLAVGSRATENAFLDRLYALLTRKDRPGSWSFLLHCMWEEATFSDEQRAAIVGGAARDLLDRPYQEWTQDQRALDEIVRLSMRHAAWTRRWISERLAGATGEDLQAIVLIRLKDEEETLASVRKRHDAAEAAAVLLDFWPATDVGEWAAEVTPGRLATTWATEAEELLILRSLAGLRRTTGGERLVPGLLVGLSRSAARMVTLARASAGRLADRPRPGGKGLPPAVTVGPDSVNLGLRPTWPSDQAFSSTADLARDFPRDFSRYVRRDFSRYFRRDFSRYLHRDFARYFLLDFAIDFAQDFCRYFPRYFPLDSATGLALHFPLDFAIDFAEDFTALPADNVPPIKQPICEWISADLASRRELAKYADAETAKRLLAKILGRLSAEGWIALMTTAEGDEDQRKVYFQRRVLNAWLLQVWCGVGERLAEDPSANRLALYLSLGWTQATTTRQWPATDRWIALLAAEPPDHWLPRSQWHLCWLLHNPDDAGHRQALAEALREGLGDEERPGVAEALRTLFPEADRSGSAPC